MYIAMWEVGTVINSVSDWITKSPFLDSVISNPFTISLLFTAIAVVVIMAVFHIKPSAAPLVRTSIYLYVITLLVMCLHQKSITRAVFNESRSSEVQAVVGGIVASQRGGQSVDYVDVRSTLQGQREAGAPPAPSSAREQFDIKDATINHSPHIRV